MRTKCISKSQKVYISIISYISYFLFFFLEVRVKTPDVMNVYSIHQYCIIQIMLDIHHRGVHPSWRVGNTGPVAAASVLGIAVLQSILSIYHPIFSPTCSLVYLSIIIFSANSVPSFPSLASLAWQVYMPS